MAIKGNSIFVCVSLTKIILYSWCITFTDIGYTEQLSVISRKFLLTFKEISKNKNKRIGICFGYRFFYWDYRHLLQLQYWELGLAVHGGDFWLGCELGLLWCSMMLDPLLVIGGYSSSVELPHGGEASMRSQNPVPWWCQPFHLKPFHSSSHPSSLDYRRKPILPAKKGILCEWR